MLPTPGSPAPSPRGEAEPPSRIVAEVLGAFTVATVVAATLYRAPLPAGWEGWSQMVMAGTFLYLPVWLLWRRELPQFGWRAHPLGRNLLLVLVVAALFLPPFFVVFAGWSRLACAAPWSWLRDLSPIACRPGGLFDHFVLRLPPTLFEVHPLRNLLASELLSVALPEEMFFRLYVQPRLDEAWPPTRRLLGAPVGSGLLAASALFALCHLAVQGSPATLTVFFPGLLFGWLRARSGSILPGVVFHAVCNVYIETLNRSFVG